MFAFLLGSYYTLSCIRLAEKSLACGKLAAWVHLPTIHQPPWHQPQKLFRNQKPLAAAVFADGAELLDSKTKRVRERKGTYTPCEAERRAASCPGAHHKSGRSRQHPSGLAPHSRTRAAQPFPTRLVSPVTGGK